MTSTALGVALTRRYQRKLATVTAATQAQLEALWDDLGSWDEPDVPVYEKQATPLVTGAQRTATALTAGYLGLLLAAAPLAVDFTKWLEAVDFRQPFLAYWGALARGEPWDKAITTGRTFSGTLSTTAVNSAAAGTSDEVDRQEPRIVGWERVLDGPSCVYCATVATQRYHTAESARAVDHDRCQCSVVPIIGKLAPGRVINRPTLDALKNGEPGAYVNPDGSPAERPDAAPVEVP